MKLVIVESPSKIKTIERYLSDEYKVLASYGHIVDLSTRGRKNLGINLETFEGDYVLDKSRQKVADTLKKAKNESSEVYLATDPDREGEAIAVHIAKLLNLDLNTTKRLEFHEITRDGITNALAAPRLLNEDLFNSQEARRMLDRIVGFELSSLLNQKINVKSAGRVQSAVLKLIVDKENEITAFVPEEYWTLKIDTKYDDALFSVNFNKSYAGDTKIVNEAMKNDIVSKLAPKIVVTDVKSEIKHTNPKPPFTTSTLQQEASSKFKYSASRTSRIIQKLYEGIQINGIETGLVTYIRTDSTRLAPSFVANASQRIVKEYGAEYLGRTQARGKILQNVQDAHEAIRPTNLNFTPDSIKDSLTREEYNLYSLIYTRALASLMVGSKEQVTRYTFNSNGTIFNATSTILIFPGFRKIYGKDEETVDDSALPQMHVGSELPIIDVITEQKFTEPPARYSEGRLIKTMEELGIGRPSTYAPTIEILQKRKYVSSLKGTLKPTDIGFRQIDALSEFFPSIISSDYTASMENELDKIANGEGDKVEFLSDFYSDFSQKIDDARKGMKKLPPEKVGRDCPKCGSNLVYREGPYGRFIGCETFPKCKYTEFIVEYTGENCPKCNEPLTYRYDSRNRKYIRCSNYKSCDYSATIKSTRRKK